MNSMFIDILKKITAEQGKEALLNPAKCKALLADYTKGEYKKESRLLLQAIDAGVQKEIITTAELELCKRQQARVLHEEYGIDQEIAANVIDTLALVLREKQESETPQGVFCTNCGKELQKEWASCPYCSTPVVKIQQSSQQPEAPPQPEAPQAEAPHEQAPDPAPDEQTHSETLTVQPLLNKEKKTKSNLIIAGAVLLIFGVAALLVILTVVVIISEITSASATASSSSNQQSAKTYYDKGLSYYTNNDFDNAITQFSEAIRLDPNNNDAFAYACRGESYRMKSQYDMAIKDLTEAIRLDPENAFAYATRGQTYRQLGQRDRAIQDLEKAISLDSNYTWAKEKLQEIRAELAMAGLANMVQINGGTFTMGSPASEPGHESPESPQHQVTVSSFYMGKYLVTQKEWTELMGTTIRQQRDKRDGSSWWSLAGEGDNYPMYYVNWYEAVEYCNRLSQREGLTPAYTIDKSRSDPNNKSEYDKIKWLVTWNQNASGYRLPTEAEWEYACRAGTTTAYNTGAVINNNTGWYAGNSGDETHPVGQKPANDWGLHDMHGNVWEWCWDWFGDYSSNAQTNPKGPSSGSERVVRGGYYGNFRNPLRSADRGSDIVSDPSSRWVAGGFRLVRSLVQ